MSQRSAISSVVGTASGHSREGLLHLGRVSSDRTRSCRSAASAARAWTSSGRTAARRGSSSPRGAGSGRRPSRPAGGPARARSARCPRSRGPAPGSCCSGPRSRRSPAPNTPISVVGVGAGLLLALLDDPLAETGLEAARERDHPLRMALQQLQVDVRLAAAKALQVAERGELDQVPEAGAVARQERQVVALVAHLLALAAVVREVGLEAQDRLHAVLAARLVELDRAVQDAVVGEPQRRHAELGARAPRAFRSCRRRRAANTRNGRAGGRRRSCSRASV